MPSPISRRKMRPRPPQVVDLACPVVLAIRVADYAALVDGKARIVAELKPEPQYGRKPRRIAAY